MTRPPTRLPFRPIVLSLEEAIDQAELPPDYVHGAIDGLKSLRAELTSSSGLIEHAARDEGEPVLELVLELVALCISKLEELPT